MCTFRSFYAAFFHCVFRRSTFEAIWSLVLWTVFHNVAIFFARVTNLKNHYLREIKIIVYKHFKRIFEKELHIYSITRAHKSTSAIIYALMRCWMLVTLFDIRFSVRFWLPFSNIFSRPQDSFTDSFPVKIRQRVYLQDFLYDSCIEFYLDH